MSSSHLTCCHQDRKYSLIWDAKRRRIWDLSDSDIAAILPWKVFKELKITTSMQLKWQGNKIGKNLVILAGWACYFKELPFHVYIRGPSRKWFQICVYVRNYAGKLFIERHYLEAVSYLPLHARMNMWLRHKEIKYIYFCQWFEMLKTIYSDFLLTPVCIMTLANELYVLPPLNFCAHQELVKSLWQNKKQNALLLREKKRNDRLKIMIVNKPNFYVEFGALKQFRCVCTNVFIVCRLQIDFFCH